MGNYKHLDILNHGKDEWNNWRANINTSEIPDFSGFNLDGKDLSEYNLNNSNFYESKLRDCILNNAHLGSSIFIKTKLNNTFIINPDRNLYSGDKRLLGVSLRYSKFAESDLQNVTMTGASLEGAHIIKCDLKGADISESDIYGISAWGNEFDDSTKQTNLVITEWVEPLITVDGLEIAQFVYMLINNKKIRSAIDTLATKLVLILGSFLKKDKEILDTIKGELSLLNFIPIIFDFDRPQKRNLTETVSTIAHLSKFIIADLSNQRSIPHELASLIPHLRSVPVIPIIRDNQEPYSMFQDYKSERNVSVVIKYSSKEPIQDLIQTIINAADSKIIELLPSYPPSLHRRNLQI